MEGKGYGGVRLGRAKGVEREGTSMEKEGVD